MKVCSVCMDLGVPIGEASQCPAAKYGDEYPDTGDMNQEIEEYAADQAMKAEYPSTSPANPKQAYGDRKPPLHLVPPALALYAAQGLGEGARKYGAYNWRTRKVEGLTYVGAAMRHLAAYLDGEDIDPDSLTGKTHLAGAIASLAILADATEGGFLIDNRPPPGPAPRLILAAGSTPKETT